MTVETMRLIEALKQNDGSTQWIVAQHLAEACGTEPMWYSAEDVEKKLREALMDYMSTCEDPRVEFRRLMFLFDDHILYRNNAAVYASFLRQTCVRSADPKYNDGKHEVWYMHPEFHYINGFNSSMATFEKK